MNLIDHFKIANFQMPQDIMHVVLEGVLAMEVKLMLSNFLENGLLSLEQLNERMLNFTYGRTEAKNKPPKPFQMSHFTATTQKLHLSGLYNSEYQWQLRVGARGARPPPLCKSPPTLFDPLLPPPLFESAL